MAITATVGGALIGAGGSYLAGQAQKSAADKATQTQLQMYNQTRQDLQPYMSGGANAFSSLQSLLGLTPGSNSSSQLQQLRNTPGYQFALQQGQTGLDRTAAARGLLLSGGQLKDSVNYNQGMADQLYGTTVNQYMGVSQLGESAAAGAGQIGQQAAAGAAGSQMAAGTAQAGMYGGIANNLGAGLYQYGTMNPNQTGSQTNYYGEGSTGHGPDPWLDNSWMTSDIRAKKEIERIGETDSGLPIYNFKYKGSQIPRMGVMAQDVERVAPAAVRTMPSGYKAVNLRAVSQLPALKRAA